MILLLLLLLVETGLAGASDIDYIGCGRNICIDEAGVGCNADGSGCDCSTGHDNLGRLQCVNPDEMCLCTMFDDPHLVDFSSDWTVLPLPCAHTIAKLSHHPEGGDTDCQLTIRGLAEYVEPNSATFASYENIIHVHLLFNSLRLDVKFEGAQEPDIQLYNMTGEQGDLISPDTYAELGVIVEQVPENFQQVIVPRCRLGIRNRGEDGSFALVTPVGSAGNEGICGQCKPVTNRATNLYQTEIFARLMDSLYPYSPIDGVDMNIYPACRVLATSVTFCPAERLDMAEGYCSMMLIDPYISPYFLHVNYTVQQVLAKLANCFNMVCQNTETCDHLASIYAGGFADGHIAGFRAIDGFCNDSPVF